MTFSSGDPTASADAQSKLSSARWRWGNSWWVVISPLTCGLLGWLGFVVAAVQTGIKKLWIAAAIQPVFLTVSIVLTSSTEFESVGSNIGAVLLLIASFGPVIPSLIWNREYLTTLAHRTAWHQAGFVAPPRHTAHTAPTGFLGVDNAQYYGQVPPPPPPPASQTHSVPIQEAPPQASTRPPLVAINSAQAAELASSLRIDEELANYVVATRQSHGFFRDLADLATIAGLQPHQLIKFRNRVTFDLPDTGHAPQAGRIVDL